jgi:hypothetical protein
MTYHCRVLHVNGWMTQPKEWRQTILAQFGLVFVDIPFFFLFLWVFLCFWRFPQMIGNLNNVCFHTVVLCFCEYHTRSHTCTSTFHSLDSIARGLVWRMETDHWLVCKTSFLGHPSYHLPDLCLSFDLEGLLFDQGHSEARMFPTHNSTRERGQRERILLFA